MQVKYHFVNTVFILRDQENNMQRVKIQREGLLH